MSSTDVCGCDVCEDCSDGTKDDEIKVPCVRNKENEELKKDADCGCNCCGYSEGPLPEGGGESGEKYDTSSFCRSKNDVYNISDLLAYLSKKNKQKIKYIISEKQK